MKMKKLTALVLAGAMMLSMAACGAKSSDSGNAGKTSGISYPGTKEENAVTIDLRAEPPQLNSFLTTDVASSDILRMVMAGLYKLDENDKPVPDLAEDTQVSEDGKTYTLKIRQDAKWTNGDPVTAHDFVYALQMVCSETTAAPYGFIVYDNILNGADVFAGTKAPEELGVKALDDYTLEVTFVSPIPYALHLFSFSSYYPMNQKAYEEIGDDKYAKDADKIVTNGAYKIDEWVHDDHITLVKDTEYYDADLINIEKVKFIQMKDANARMNAFKAGEVDTINLTGEQLQQAKAAGMKTASYVDNSNWYLEYNVQKKELSSAKIRKALGISVDMKSFCENVLKDGSVPATGFTPTGIGGVNNTTYADAVGTVTEYNVDKAKKLFEEGLAEIGMKAEDYKISFLVDDTSNAQQQAAYFQEQWKQALGITVEITPMPFKSRLAAMDSGDFDIVLAGWAPDYNDAMTFLDMFTTTNGNNYGKYSSEVYDKLIADAVVTVDPEERQAKLVEAETLLVAEDCPVYPLYFTSVTYAVSDKLEGMTRTGFQEFDFQDGAKIVK